MSESISKLYDGCRSYRRFEQKDIPAEVLEDIVETARKRSSGGNIQPLRYVVVSGKDTVEKIQPHVHWAAKLPKEIGTPHKDEEPTAFIVLLVPADKAGAANIDVGIAIDTLAITAWSHGVGSCMMGAIDREEIGQIIGLPDGYAVSLVLALGYPANKSTLVEPDSEHGLNYYVDSDRNYYVPKRPASEVIRFI